MQLRDLLREHARQLGGGPLTLDSHGTCHLMVNDKHLVTLEEVDERTFFVYSEVAALPTHDNEAIFQRLLQANLYGKATQGCVFALDAHGTHVILFKEFTTQVTDLPIYLEGFETFVHQLAYWKDLLKAPSSGTQPPEPPIDHRKESGKWIKS